MRQFTLDHEQYTQTTTNDSRLKTTNWSTNFH